jgi:UrcA family protein
MSTLNTRSIAAFALTAALTGVSLPAQAEQPKAPTDSNININVKFRDLDLSKPEGVAALYDRIERSARLVCKDTSSPWDAERVETFQRCYQAAIQDAVSAVNHPQLTARHRARTSKPPVQVGDASK